MKTLKDLKIGDKCYYISGLEILNSKIISISSEKNNRIITTEKNNCSILLGDIYSKVSDETMLESYHYKYIYFNYSEAIIELKQRIFNKISNNIIIQEKATNEIKELKIELEKYI